MVGVVGVSVKRAYGNTSNPSAVREATSARKQRVDRLLPGRSVRSRMPSCPSSLLVRVGVFRYGKLNP